MKRLTRRQFLAACSAGAATVAAAGTGVDWLTNSRGGSRVGVQGVALSPPPRVAHADRALVVIEMAGGNDGPTMLVPYSDPAYRNLRRRTAVDAGTVLRVDGRVGLHPALARLHRRGIAAIEGVGVSQPDLSHFEMLRRWWVGDPSPSSAIATGFLGRLCDVIGGPDDPAVGVSLGTGPSPALTADRVTTLSLPDPSGAFPVPADDGLVDAWRAGWNAMAHPDRIATTPVETAARGARQAARFSEVITALPPPAGGYGDSALDAQLALAARLLAAGAGIRIIHVPMDADFDTHENHRQRAKDNLALLDRALDSFLTDLALRGLDQTTLMATTSEFGRRVADNGSSGLDHGTASVALLAGGPVRPGVYGQPLSLTRLDPDGNLVATVNMTEYYATLAEWLQVSPHDVLPGCPTRCQASSPQGDSRRATRRAASGERKSSYNRRGLPHTSTVVLDGKAPAAPLLFPPNDSIMTDQDHRVRYGYPTFAQSCCEEGLALSAGWKLRLAFGGVRGTSGICPRCLLHGTSRSTRSRQLGPPGRYSIGPRTAPLNRSARGGELAAVLRVSVGRSGLATAVSKTPRGSP